MNYRSLSQAEIATLEQQGCSAEDWSKVEVRKGFTPSKVKNVQFAGFIKLGVFNDLVEVDEGISKQAGLYNAYIQDCVIGNNTFISNVKNLVRYDIGEGVAIENVSTILMSGESTFGNGVRIEVLNEGGGREKPLFDKITSQIAYMIVTYRHDAKLVDKIYDLIDEYVETRKSSRGTIGDMARIIHSNYIKNVYIDKNAVISGAMHLEEGTIISNKHAPAFIGEGVIAKEFIMLSDSRIDGASMIDKCIIGQGVKIGKQYSAENSGFFANSEGFHGEALSVFAGPYTVTHHKSTLLIAGLFSFYNAGSGSNQSNHMYKLGPIHQGILERGAKTGSFSYMMWPCRVGAFTGVIGKHYANFDTTDFPFSYILDSNGKSLLMPAMNLCTVGTRRDSSKWPNRDRRKDPDKRDLLNFELYSPYTIGKILQGMNILKKLEKDTKESEDYIQYKGITIRRSKMSQAYDKYEMAVNIFIGQQIIKQLKRLNDELSFESLRDKLYIQNSDALGNWIDMSGMLAPSNVIEGLIASIRNNQVKSLEDFENQLKVIHSDYDKYAWAWCIDLIEKRLEIAFKEITRENIVRIISDYEQSSVTFNELVLEDAYKEFSEKSRIGYGIDGDETIRDQDFEAVLGKYEENKFVNELKKESETIKEKADRLISEIKDLQV